MDLKQIFETIAGAQSPAWGFEYARRDYQNLIDSTDWVADALNNYGTDETIFFCDPIKRGKTKAGAETFSGSFMVLTRSDHDEVYEQRYIKFIEPILSIIMGGVRNKLLCDFDVDTWQTTELINVFDWNADGLLVTYNITRP